MSDRTIAAIDRISEVVGKAIAWLILPLSLALGYEVASRYAFNRPTTWAFDASYIMYGTYFVWPRRTRSRRTRTCAVTSSIETSRRVPRRPWT